MPTQITIRGIVRVDRQGVSEQEVLLISKGLDQFLGACSTDAAGRFDCPVDLTDDAASVVALAKITSRMLTVVHRTVTVPQNAPLEIDVDSHVGFFDLEGRIGSSVGRPDSLCVFFDPIAIDGVPESLGRFFKQKGREVFDNHFSYETIRGDTFTFRVAPGTYNLGGDSIVYERPMLVTRTFQNYIVDKVTLGPHGRALPGDPYRGFTLTVKENTTVNLELRVVDDREL